MEQEYIALYKSGELARRTDELETRLASCDICPRGCGINRLEGEQGFCHSGYLPIVSTVCAHHGEEPVLSGSRGSGTIFFGNCNMRCAYCQNHQISQCWQEQETNEVNCHTLLVSRISHCFWQGRTRVSARYGVPQGAHKRTAGSRAPLRELA